MTDNKTSRRGRFPYLELPRIGEREPVTDMAKMALEFMKYQGEIAYEVSKRQAIALTSTASTIGIGWSAFFYGLTQEAWLTSSLGFMMAFAGTFFLGYWTPRIADKLRQSLDSSGVEKFCSKWLSDSAKGGTNEEGP